ncbi:type VI secretion system tip protein VgrG, partial [Pseudomonas sp. CCC3.2]|nr:type VI secretion system tip protein VgrG [Pseudomonas sp. CCC3.2]
ELPANKTKSVFRSRSSKASQGFNEVSFEDRNGAELVYLRAQRDMQQLVQNDSRLEVRGQRLETIKGNSVSVLEAEHHQTISGDRKVQLSAGDHLQVAGSSHTRVASALVIEAGQDVHYKSSANFIVNAGVTLTLAAGGQHLVITPAGIFSSVPVLLGGAPLPGMPAMPLAPAGVDGLEAEMLAPVATPDPAIQQKLSGTDTMIELCQKPKDGTPMDCPLADCPCREAMSKGAHA